MLAHTRIQRAKCIQSMMNCTCKWIARFKSTIIKQTMSTSSLTSTSITLQAFLDDMKARGKDLDNSAHIRGTFYELSVRMTLMDALNLKLKNVGGTRDNGADLIGFWNMSDFAKPQANPVLARELARVMSPLCHENHDRVKFVVQCKNYKRLISPKEVRELSGISKFQGAISGTPVVTVLCAPKPLTRAALLQFRLAGKSFIFIQIKPHEYKGYGDRYDLKNYKSGTIKIGGEHSFACQFEQDNLALVRFLKELLTALSIEVKEIPLDLVSKTKLCSAILFHYRWAWVRIRHHRHLMVKDVAYRETVFKLENTRMSLEDLQNRLDEIPEGFLEPIEQVIQTLLESLSHVNTEKTEFGVSDMITEIPGLDHGKMSLSYTLTMKADADRWRERIRRSYNDPSTLKKYVFGLVDKIERVPDGKLSHDTTSMGASNFAPPYVTEKSSDSDFSSIPIIDAFGNAPFLECPKHYRSSV